ncbi:uncharacterized protein LOC100141576 [Tribolium castaneum]|uniref:Uncharacterized protein n=1 Tax=Tribolium castaneum TaxID=7070 RepID=D6WSP0_TRICA|nr:PREDICTED: uncharacterized protein LOC100141576 [Tribolium castaneum]EFA05888.1 hypothetical protein TcasGA2_TC008700 [Tribolium castaneum]|eukprot:XP_001811865.1 PREDICTED: uncharacterized protein LOC100141576 [Tribolium castaneum]
MNSDGTQRSGVNKDNLPSSSQVTNPDSNANLSLTTNESKGAIPKTKLAKIASKKTNNNVDETSVLTVDPLKINGFTKNTSPSSNYLNNTYVECVAANVQISSKDVHKGTGFAQSSLNIPVENDFLNGPYLPVHNCGSSYGDLVEAGASYREPNLKDDDSSSDDNELLSLSDDGCIYTYKGDHVADLPSSFYNLEIPPLDEVPGNGREENSSPEMDFLEMDFDPGPSGDADSDSISNAEIDNAASLPLDSKTEKVEEPKPCCSKDLNNDLPPESSNINKFDNGVKSKYLNLTKTIPEPIKEPIIAIKNEIKMPWSCTLSERTRTAKSLRMVKRHHSSRGELSSPSEIGLNNDINITNLTSFHNATGKILIDDKNSVDCDVEKTMIWTHHEACVKQITQVGPSACGATAVLNVLNALRFPIPTLEKVQECVNTRLRANSSPLTEYLLSRSQAGCTHRDLIVGLYKLSEKRLYSRFFAMYPERVVNLQSWLGYWIKNGAVPIATLNLQKCEGSIPDSWHHQMIFGVGPEGIYLTNPLECIDPAELWPQLSSESVLLVRTEDVISRWNPKVDLPQLMRINDVRWKELNVVGQIAKVVRESRREARADYISTSHIQIPAEYKAGITLVLDINSPAFTLLRQCPELPLLQPEYAASAL